MESALAPFERRLQGVIARMQVSGPVRTRQIASFVNQPVRTVRHYLRQMEDAGIVCRPAGVRSGYATAPDALPRQYDEREIARRLDALDLMLVDLLSQPLTSVDLADCVDIPRRTVSYRMRKMEELGVVARPYGERSGYVATVKPNILSLVRAMLVVDDLVECRVDILREFLTIPRGMRLRSNYVAMSMGMPARTMRYHLHALDALGLVERTRNRKLGYGAIRPVADYVVQLFDEAG